MVKIYHHKRWFFVICLADVYVSFIYNVEKFNSVYFVLPVVKIFEIHTPHKNMKVTMLQLVKGSGKKASRCQSCTKFFSEALTNVCGARELRKI